MGLVKSTLGVRFGVSCSNESDTLRPFKFINTNVFVRPDGIPVTLIKFAARYKSGDIKLEEGAFTDSAWVNAQEVHDYSCIMGIPEEVAAAIKLFTKPA